MSENTVDSQMSHDISRTPLCLASLVSFASPASISNVQNSTRELSTNGLFSVRNFTGLNIAVVGAQGARISYNTLIDGQRYGFLTLGSKNTRASHNFISSTPNTNPFIALCMDDISDVEVSYNNISGYITGLCVQTNGADVKGNHVEDSCYSIFVDPGIVGAKVRWNTVGKSAVICGFLPFPASFGIIVGGGKDTQVMWNYVEGINDGGNDTKTAVGVSTNLSHITSLDRNLLMNNRLRFTILQMFNHQLWLLEMW